MIRIALGLLVALLVACSSSSKETPKPEAKPEPTKPISVTSTVRCLPVVAKECGCVYDCGRGESSDGKTWRVKHTFWKDTELKAVIEPWCVDGKCTDVFAAEIVCGGICAPKPADPNCKC